jgi:hypothetical protein
MTRTPFLDAPQSWLYATRRSQSRADYANPIERFHKREKVSGVALAVIIGLALAAVLFLGLSA